MLWQICVILLVIPHLAEGKKTCNEAGWFGENCRMKCHCLGGDDKCKPDGTCKDGCDEGYMGDHCQDEIVASYIGNMTKAIPTGVVKDIGCNNNIETVIELKTPKPTGSHMAHMQIWTNIDAKEVLRKIYIKLDNKYALCADPRINTQGLSIITIYCGRFTGLLANTKSEKATVSIHGRGVSHVCQVLISGGRNMALKQNATLSAGRTVPEGDVATVSDGNAETCLTLNSNEALHFNLAGPTNVFSTRLKPNKKKHVRLNFYRGERKINSGDITATTSVHVLSTVYQHVDKVTLTISGSSTVEVCEFEIYGACPHNMIGSWCDIVSKPQNPWDVCTPTSGCKGVTCSSGFSGKFCDTVCRKGFWGPSCRSRCSRGCNATDCYPTNGLCASGCAVDAIPPNCILNTTQDDPDEKNDMIEMGESGLDKVMLIVIGILVCIALLVMVVELLKPKNDSDPKKDEDEGVKPEAYATEAAPTAIDGEN